MSAFYLIGFVQAVFFSIIIFTKRNFKIYDFFLALFFVVMGCYLFFVYANESGLYMEHPLIILTDFIYWSLLGPILYLYIEFVIHKDKRIKPIHLIHFLPALITFLTFFDFIFISDIEHLGNYENESILFEAGLYVWYYNTPLYFIIVLIKLRQHRKQIKQYFSNTKHIDLRWLRLLTYGFALFLLFLYGSGFYRMITGAQLPFSSYHYSWLIMVLYILGLGFYGYKQRGVFTDFEEIQIVKHQSNPTNLQLLGDQPYQRSGLSSVESESIMTKLNRYMDEEKPYLDFDINLKSLAESLDTTTHKLSQVLNERLEQNFFEFINKYRVEEVKKHLADPEKISYKIISLAYDAGFNSKSSFYTIFKKYTNLTPAEYRAKFIQEDAVA